MNVAEMIYELRQAGVIIEARGDRLHIEAPKGLLTPERREVLRAHKAELLVRLARRDERVTVVYSLVEAPHLHPVVIGTLGDTAEDVVENLRRRYGKRLVSTHVLQ